MKIKKWSAENLKDLDGMDLDGKQLKTINNVKFVKDAHGPVCLGKGGYGMVFKAFVSGKFAAIKVYISFLCLFQEFHENHHSVTSYFLKKDSKRCCDTTTPGSIHTKDESKRGSAFAFIFGVN